MAAACGVPVAKHGIRGVSSSSGSSDVLTALGVTIDLPPEAVADCLDELGIGFCFAPLFHSAMKHAAGVRQQLRLRTIFNLIGPLTNPAGAKRQLIGVYDGDLTDKVAGVLNELGSERAFVVHGSDGLDEITLTGPTKLSELNGRQVTTREVSPGDFGLQTVAAEALSGGAAPYNAQILRAVLDGEQGPRRDVVLLNAAAAIAAGGLVGDMAAGIDVAREAIDSGKARQALYRLVEVSNA